jgi:pimeloyl-ACP methyl ester carboxylesterase
VAILTAIRKLARVSKLALTAPSVGVEACSFGGVDWLPDYRRAYPGAASSIADSVKDMSDERRALDLPVLLIFGSADPIVVRRAILGLTQFR